MKKVKYLAMLLAAGMFAACSDNLEDAGAGNAGGIEFEGETGYVNISLNLPTTSGNSSRAESFDDGLAAEYNVNNAIIALFYGTSESNAQCKVAFQLNNGDFQMQGTTTDNITSYYASGVRMIPAPANSDEKVFALAILNPTSNFTVTSATDATKENAGDAVLTTKLQINSKDFVETVTDGTGAQDADLADFNKVAEYSAAIASTNNNGSFLMTNAPIANAISFASGSKPDNFAVTTLAKIEVYNDRSLAEGAASANPIYVERAVAKTTVKVNSADGSLTVDSEVPAYDEAKVTFTGEGNGWKLQNTNKFYFPVRNTYDATNGYSVWVGYFNGGLTSPATEVNRFFGQTANPCRTYWGIDPNYTAILTSTGGTGQTLVDNFTTYTSASAPATWNTVGTTSTATYSGNYVEYCAENTTLAKVMQDDQLTGVLLKATFTPKGANAGSNFFMLNNTSAIYLEDGDHGFIAWATAVLANGGTGIPLGEGVTLSLKDDLTELTKKTITTYSDVQALLKTSATSSELTQGQAEAILNAAGGNIKFYQGGVCYYYASIIEHFGDAQAPIASTTTIDNATSYDEAKHLGRWGVVRNNWYELNITKVSGPGEPDIPEIPTTPPDKTNSYINCEINVLSWAKRTQDVEL